LGFVVALSAWGAPAAAQVTQTDAVSTPLPQPVPLAEATLVNDSWAWNANTRVSRDKSGALLTPQVRYGDFYSPPTYPQFVTGDAINLSGLFKWRHEAIDPVKDAKTWPGYFSAKCGFSVELVLMGGNCQAQFGWYNVTDPNSKTPPAATEIYPVMKGKPNQLLTCTNGEEMPPTIKQDGFCPLAWDNRHPYNLSVERWKIVTFASGDISKDPKYKGGYIGFAMIGDPNKCPSNKFSMYEHNERNASGVPWVTTLVYQSTVDTSGFYFAFEDMPMSAADWTKKSGSTPGADGDFNDLVFYVKGLACPGGNQACNTGQLGVCAIGRTECAPEGQTPACRPLQQPSAELCDNLDNDCDGVIDNGVALCSNSSAPVCFHGACVASCKDGFPCPIGTTCSEDGRCIEPTCAAVSCQPGKVCRAGACADPCSGVVCPYGSQCQLGECVDPCALANCPADRVCEKGLCLPKCDCRGCDPGLTCGSEGRCVDSACVGTVCPSGTTCLVGACVDPCAGVLCPDGGVCSQGACSAPPSGGGPGQGGAGPITFPGNSGAGGRKNQPEEAGAAGEGEAGTATGDGGTHDPGAASAGRQPTAAGGAHSNGGAISQGGTIAAAGGHSPISPAQQSSSCRFAPSERGVARQVTPLLGLLLGLALERRRRRRSART